jgi:hypothetical protein
VIPQKVNEKSVTFRKPNTSPVREKNDPYKTQSPNEEEEKDYGDGYKDIMSKI